MLGSAICPNKQSNSRSKSGDTRGGGGGRGRGQTNQRSEQPKKKTRPMMLVLGQEKKINHYNTVDRYHSCPGTPTSNFCVIRTMRWGVKFFSFSVFPFCCFFFVLLFFSFYFFLGSERASERASQQASRPFSKPSSKTPSQPHSHLPSS